jgi:hypothetical protein
VAQPFDIMPPDVYVDIDPLKLQMEIDEARQRVEDLKFERLDMNDADRRAFEAQGRAAADEARASMDARIADGRAQVADVQRGRTVTTVRVEPFRFTFSGGGPYNDGLNALQQRQYERAVTAFDRVISQKGSRTDGALYWKAFAQSRLSHGDDALATLAALRRDYPQSRYLNDAKVLEADVRRTAGQPVDIDAMNASEEIKLLAISGIADSDPDKAIPLLQGVLAATNTLAVKKRAIYVLALSNDERAHQILLEYAKGGGNPDLQAEAIRYLASRRDRPTTAADLKQVYDSTQDPDIRRTILNAYSVAGAKAPLLAVAGNRAESVDLRRSAVAALTNLASPQELWTLYQQEPEASVRAQMVNAFRVMGADDQILQVAKSDADASVRQRAVRSLVERKDTQVAPVLLDLYGTQTDLDMKKTIIAALGSQNAASALVTLARKETNIDLKRDIVRRLSEMAPKNKEAADALMDMLK